MDDWTPPTGGPPRWFHRELSIGDRGDDVKIVQRKVDARMSGTYDQPTAARVRGVQKKKGLPQTGAVDEATAEALGEKPNTGSLPGWFTRDVCPGDHGPDVDAVRILLKQPNLPVYVDSALENEVRRFQSENGLTPSGVVDESTARLLADRSA